MFHVKQYLDALRSWNTIHRLIGNVSCETLFKESLDAIKNSEKDLSNFSTMSDLGAGSGILGAAWLSLNPSNKCIFLEPDRKAAAFLLSYFGSAAFSERLESPGILDRMLRKYPGTNTTNTFIASRAFSSNDTLENIYIKSELSEYELYNFEANPKVLDSYSLVKKLYKK